MADERIRVVVEGEARDLERALKQAARDLGNFDKQTVRTGRAARQMSREVDGVERSVTRASGAANNLDDAIGRLNRNFTAFRNLRSPLALAAMASGLSVAAKGAVELAAGLTAVAGAAARVAPAAASGLQAVTALVQAGGTLKLATNGLSDALKAQTKASQAQATATARTARAETAAAEQVRNARGRVADADDRVRDARERLTAAQREARHEQDALTRSAEQAGFAQRRAEGALQDALRRRRELRNDPTASVGDLTDANLNVDEARVALRDARREATETARASQRAQREGVRQATQVTDAQRQLVRAQRDSVEAAHDLSTAQKTGADATGQVASEAAKAQEAMDALPASAQRFAKVLLANQGKLKQLRTAAADGLFPGATSGLKSALRNFDVVERAVGRTARVLGGLADQAGRLAGSPGFGRDLDKIASSNARVLDDLGDATIILARALADVLVEAGPLTEWLSSSAEDWARLVARETDAARKSGDMAESFRDARRVLQTLGDIAGNTGATLSNVLGAGADTGEDLLDMLEDATARWREWTGSVKGQNELSAYFDHAKPTVVEAARLLAAVGKELADLGAQPGTDQLIRKLRTELVPAVGDLAQSLSGDFAQQLVNALTSLATILSQLVSEGGGLTQALRVINLLLDGFENLVGGSEALQQTLATAFTGLTLYKLLGIGAALNGLKTLRERMRTLPPAPIAPGTAAPVGPRPATRPGERVTPGGVVLPAGVTPPPAAAVAPTRGQQARGMAIGAAGSAASMAGWAAGLAVLSGAISELNEDASGIDKNVNASVRRMNAELGRLKATGAEKTFFGLQREWDKLIKSGASGDEYIREVDRLIRAHRELGKTEQDIDAVNRAIARLSHGSTDSLTNLRASVRLNMTAIRRSMGDDSEAARVAMSQNFLAATDAVKRSMREGKVATADGAKEIARLMRENLALFGITGKDATRYMRGQDTTTGKSESQGSRQDAGRGFAGGGWIGNAGERGADTEVVRVGRGEAILNADQQADTEHALAVAHAVGASPHGSLDDVFRNNQRSHWATPAFAKGGIVALGRRLQKQGIHVSEHPAFGGVGRHMVGSRHYTGDALDLNVIPPGPGDSAEAARFDRLAPQLRRQGWNVLWRVKGHAPGDNSHLHVDTGGGAGGGLAGIGATARKLKLPEWGGPGGAVGAMGRTGLRRLRGAGQTILDRAAGTAGAHAGDIDGDVGLKGSVQTIVRQLAKTRGWDAGQVGDWLKLIQGESGGRTNARNPTSGAYGIGQFLGATLRAYAKYGATSPEAGPQLNAMAQYIADRYGTPARALAQWMARKPHWYAKGKPGKSKPRKKRSNRTKTAGGIAGRMTQSIPGIQTIVDRADGLGEQLALLTGRSLPVMQRIHDRTQEDVTRHLKVGDPALTPDLITNTYGPGGVDRILGKLGPDGKRTGGLASDTMVEVRNESGFTDPARGFVGGISQRVAELTDEGRLRSDVARLAGEQHQLTAEIRQAAALASVERAIALHNLKQQWQEAVKRLRDMKRRAEKIADRAQRLRRKLGGKLSKTERARTRSELANTEAEGKQLNAEIRAVTGLAVDLGGDTEDGAAGKIGRMKEQLDLAGDLWTTAGGRLPDLETAAINARMDVEDINLEIGGLNGTRLALPDAPEAEKPQDDMAARMAELTKQLKDAQLQSNLLASVHAGVFQGLAPLIGGRLVGAFAHGGPIRETGLALVHAGEYVVPDPRGPYGAGMQAAPAAGGGVQVTIVMENNERALMRVVDARVDGRAARVASEHQGRMSRLILAAPGGS